MPATPRITSDRPSRNRALFTLEAQRLIGAGRAKEAVEICKQGLIYHPENPTGYILLARAYQMLGEKERAANVLSDGYRRTGSTRIRTLHQQLTSEGSRSDERRAMNDEGGRDFVVAAEEREKIVEESVMMEDDGEIELGMVEIETIVEEIVIEESIDDEEPVISDAATADASIAIDDEDEVLDEDLYDLVDDDSIEEPLPIEEPLDSATADELARTEREANERWLDELLADDPNGIEAEDSEIESIEAESIDDSSSAEPSSDDQSSAEPSIAEPSSVEPSSVEPSSADPSAPDDPAIDTPLPSPLPPSTGRSIERPTTEPAGSESPSEPVHDEPPSNPPAPDEDIPSSHGHSIEHPPIAPPDQPELHVHLTPDLELAPSMHDEEIPEKNDNLLPPLEEEAWSWKPEESLFVPVDHQHRHTGESKSTDAGDSIDEEAIVQEEETASTEELVHTDEIAQTEEIADAEAPIAETTPEPATAPIENAPTTDDAPRIETTTAVEEPAPIIEPIAHEESIPHEEQISLEESIPLNEQIAADASPASTTEHRTDEQELEPIAQQSTESPAEPEKQPEITAAAEPAPEEKPEVKTEPQLPPIVGGLKMMGARGASSQTGARSEGSDRSRHLSLALHAGKSISRLRSSNLRLIPGLEFAPLRHEDQLRRQSIAPLISEPMPQPEVRSRAAKKAIEESTLPPLPSLGPITRPEGTTGAAAPSQGPTAPSAPERPETPRPLTTIRMTSLPESGESLELTPLEELARRLENARIPVVEEPEQRTAFEPSIVSDTLANILVSQGAYVEALKAFQTLARIKPERVEYYQEKIQEMKWRLRNPESPWPPGDDGSPL